MSKTFTFSCWLLAFIFVLFAALQYNDPDPYLWIPLYMFEAILCIAIIFKPVNKILLIGTCIAYLAGSYYLFPEKYQGVEMPMNERVPEIEEARESLGLLICAIASLWLLFLSYRKRAISIKTALLKLLHWRMQGDKEQSNDLLKEFEKLKDGRKR